MANSTADTPGVSETKLAKMRLRDLREHARERGIAGADDLHKPELLARVKDWHYVQEHGEHRPDAAGRAGEEAGIVAKGDARRSPKKGPKKGAAKDTGAAASSAGKSSGGKSSGGKSSGGKSSGGRSSGKDRAGRDGGPVGPDARRAIAEVRRRLAKAESALDDLEAALS